jgi:type II secretory pathway pseudopilin PulG
MRFSIRTILATLVVLALIGAGSIAVLTKSWQRFDIDAEWALQVVSDAEGLQTRLHEYRSANGEFPDSLKEIDSGFNDPTGFYEPKSTDGWHYRRLGKSDYQLYAIGTSFVSTYDAMVFRYSGDYPSEWFRPLDTSHSKTFGEWRYITGFSELENAP